MDEITKLGDKQQGQLWGGWDIREEVKARGLIENEQTGNTWATWVEVSNEESEEGEIGKDNE